MRLGWSQWTRASPGRGICGGQGGSRRNAARLPPFDKNVCGRKGGVCEAGHPRGIVRGPGQAGSGPACRQCHDREGRRVLPTDDAGSAAQGPGGIAEFSLKGEEGGVLEPKSPKVCVPKTAKSIIPFVNCPVFPR